MKKRIHLVLVMLLAVLMIAPEASLAEEAEGNEGDKAASAEVLQDIGNYLWEIDAQMSEEAFTLANHRQYVFWLLFMLASHKDAKE